MGGTQGEAVALSEEPELPLNERIAILTQLRDSGDPDIDLPAVCGALGESWLERAERDDDEGAARTGLGYLAEAVEAAPEHDDRMSWWICLGFGHSALAESRRSVDDYDRAIGWLGKVLDDMAPDDVDRDEVVITWMASHWERFQLLRYGAAGDPATAGDDADRLVAALASRSAGGNDPASAYQAQLFRGLGLLERYDLTDRRSDLDDGIAALAGAIPHVVADDGTVRQARFELVHAYQIRAYLDDDRHSADLAISAGEELIGATGADQSWALPYFDLALAYKWRWEDGGDRTDLDRSIDCWRVLLAEGTSAWTAGRCGDLLRRRSELTDDPADIVEAVPLLELAASDSSDQDDRPRRWYQLGMAYQRQAKLLRMPGQLVAAVDCMDRALALGVPDEFLLTVHALRMSMAFDSLRADDDSGPQPWATALARRLLPESGAVFERLASAPPEQRALLAGMLGLTEMWVAGLDAGEFDSGRILDRLDVGRQVPDDPDWLALMDMAAGLARHGADMMRIGGSGEAGLAALTHAMSDPDLNESIQATVRRLLPVLLQGRTSRSGDLRGQSAAISMLTGGVTPADGSALTGLDAESRLMVLAHSLAELWLNKRYDEVAALGRQAEDILATVPQSPINQLTLVPLLTLVRHACALAEGRQIERTDLPPLTAVEGAHPAWELMARVIGVACRYAWAVQHEDMIELRECADHLETLSEHAEPGSIARLGLCLMAGAIWINLAQRDRADATAARRAVRWYEEATESAGGPAHPLWASFALNLAESLRLAGDPDLARTRELGRSALRGHEWQVLLQAGTDHAIEAAHAAAQDAAKVAGWCLQDRAHDELLQALDAGRGLVLRAAASSRAIADELDAVGHRELAAEWRGTAGLGRDRLTGGTLSATTAGTEIPDDLRERVLRALRGGGAAASAERSSEAVRVADVQAALSAVGADALVYLVPATDDCPGTAVVVPEHGEIDPLSMPELVAGTGSALDVWAGTTRGVRDVTPMPWPDRPSSEPLDELCRWAWTACVGQLIDYVRRWHLHRPARLVLVPMGMLGLVPWHAAYTPTDTGRRYAIADLVISYGVSARTFCAMAGLPSRPIGSTLVVGNPGGDLAFAGIEADAVHRSFYSDGANFGHSSDRAGTPSDVLDWLSSTPGPTRLHFACHGMVDPRRPADAHLVLAGGQTLTARALLEASRLRALDIDQVFLAACTTGVMGEDHDEALSLATAFLTAGARVVFGSLWPVPDTDTSLLMYMVHHHLNVEACEPMDALHRAQLWMLDPDRKVPAGMPDDLVRYCRGPAPARPIAWAGFTHMGR